jgi:hypothetical protein
MDPHAGLIDPSFARDECSVNYMFEVRVVVAGGEKGDVVSCGYFHTFVVAEI